MMPPGSRASLADGFCLTGDDVWSSLLVLLSSGSAHAFAGQADAAGAPLGEDVRLDRQRLQRRAIDLFEQLSARHAEPSDRTLFVEKRQEFADRRIDVGKAVKCPVTKPPKS